MNAAELRAFCIKHRYFEGGTNSQYSKLFEYNSYNFYDLRGIATIIWLCSDTPNTISGIAMQLAEEIRNG